MVLIANLEEILAFLPYYPAMLDERSADDPAEAYSQILAYYSSFNRRGPDGEKP